MPNQVKSRLLEPASLIRQNQKAYLVGFDLIAAQSHLQSALAYICYCITSQDHIGLSLSRKYKPAQDILLQISSATSSEQSSELFDNLPLTEENSYTDHSVNNKIPYNNLLVRNVYGITSRSYNAGFLLQLGWPHEAHSYSTQRMRPSQLEQKNQLEIGKLFHARSLVSLREISHQESGKQFVRKI